MFKVLGCIATEHDHELLLLSAAICVLGCFTTTTFMARAVETSRGRPYRWLLGAAAIFGCSVWSLHFVAMLAFTPGQGMAYDLRLTLLSALVVTGGAGAALFAWLAPMPRAARAAVGGVLLGLGIAGMHYLGVAAMSFSGFLVLAPGYVAASVVVSVGFGIVALARAAELDATSRRFEVAGLLALAVCGLHFTGMAAVALVPGQAAGDAGAVLGTTSLAVAVGGVSLVVLIGSLAATLVEQRMSQRTVQELGRMRLMSNLAREVLLIHGDGTVLEINSAGERLFKAPAEALIGRPVLALFTADSLPILARRECTPALGRPPEEVEIATADGTHVAVELTCQPIDYLGKPATVVALRDLTDRKRDEALIQHLARHDALTGLPNRYTLLERLTIALNVAAQQRSSLAVVYLDLDRFKPVNDLHGHATGDALLVQASKRVQAELHPQDTLARIGGDEFVLVLVAEPEPEAVSVLVTRAIDALGRSFQVEGRRIEIGASAGIALYPADGADADALMRAADAAMYRAKEQGRGSLRFYETSMNAQLQARLQLEHDLAGAAERGELVLHYQPMVNGASGKLETLEALIRWNHPVRGLVPPLDFIPLAEQTGLIDPIGRWVVETACRDAAGWEQPWRVSVNVSPKQFQQSDVCGTIRAALRASGLHPGRLVVEVTEGVLIEDAAKAVTVLNQLRELGIRIALDDFGTGYSSLSYLRLFKFDKFKIDRSFVRELGQNEDALTLTRTIINLGHNLGLDVTAEGVETQAQLGILQGLGCDQIQGFLVARPAPADAFTERDRLRTMSLFGNEYRASLSVA